MSVSCSWEHEYVKKTCFIYSELYWFHAYAAVEPLPASQIEGIGGSYYVCVSREGYWKGLLQKN
jgi:hypothetical protein